MPPLEAMEDWNRIILMDDPNGLCFCAAWPVEAGRVLRARVPISRLPRFGLCFEGSPTTMKILLVDDHVLFREGIALLLKSLVAGDSLYQAGTCEEAVAKVSQDPSIELVLMDINLPGTSGINAIALIRAKFPLIPV